MSLRSLARCLLRSASSQAPVVSRSARPAARQFSAARVLSQSPAPSVGPSRPLKPLPSLPPAPPYPCPLITQEELDEYLIPLYDHDWRVAVKDNLFGLQRRINITKYKFVLEFVNELAEYAKAESHHPEITFTYSSVTVRLLTHSATSHPSGENPEPTQGITMRDVRLAILTERLVERFLDAGYIGAKTFAVGRVPYNVEALGAVFGRRELACFICQQPGHKPNECPQRFTTPPNQPCTLCGDLHWRFLCPRTKTGRRAMREAQRKGASQPPSSSASSSS
ncbi:transcriptional coactivator/pterin dehydratase [Exidia glandulosa HHB12029]|uniref:4a-hydroxytetrahydrobiopterin dehydratase n=1 Tax=Exidia glandulosa HHB12029 TaxID=1314781 RepID=A0A165IHD7_EXIGL|nr:transcriptional coactivator/pterin dehydratase [Exidia glandulosa HHB12029]